MVTISKPEQIFDVRLVERHVASGRIARKDHEQYLKQLADAAENSEVIPKDVIFDLPNFNKPGEK
jgi:hypothetical protein